MKLNLERIRLREEEEREKKQLEQHCHELLMATPTWAADAHGNNVYVSDSFLEETGWRRDQLLGTKWMRCIDPDYLATALKGYLDSIREQDVFNQEYPIRRNNLTQYRIRAVTAPRYNREGKFVGITGLAIPVD